VLQVKQANVDWGSVLYAVFIVGMAGSGKSLLTASFKKWLELNDQDALTLNLDPGAVALPYNPDIDSRNYVSVVRLMEEYELGPNGALVMAADLMGEHLEEIRKSVEESMPDVLLVDTPGQIELFAFRESGPYITGEITDDPKAVVYLFDSPFSRNPLNYVSNMFLAAAVYNRLLQPQVYALTKSDLISEEELERVVGWSEEIEQLEFALEQQTGETASLISKDVANTIMRIGLNFETIPVSAKTETGFIELYAALTRIFAGGEEPRP